MRFAIVRDVQVQVHVLGQELLSLLLLPGCVAAAAAATLEGTWVIALRAPRCTAYPQGALPCTTGK